LSGTPTVPSGIDDYRKINRSAWAYLAAHGSDSSQPYQPDQLAAAGQHLRASGFLPNKGVGRVLVLGGGGGQQGPLFASMGYDVTVADLSPDQLRRDQDFADQLGIDLECVELDMLNLEFLYGRDFDLVHQPISACYVPDVRLLYLQVAQVLRPGGWYDVEHWNPVHVQLRGCGEWVDSSYLVERPQLPGEPVVWHPDAPGDHTVVCWHFVHPLDRLIGGLCRAGFVVRQLAERTHGDPQAPPGSHEHLAAYVPPFLRMLAQRSWRP